MAGPNIPVAEQLHAEKYRGPGESFRNYAARVAGALRDNSEHFYHFREALLDQRFLPAGRVQAAMGSTKIVTPYNCFVSGTIEDSAEGIMKAATDAFMTMRLGGGIGYDFSTLRPRNEMIRTLLSRSSGPITFMHIFNEVCNATSSAGNRRGAQMGVMRVDHPDIEEFIYAKQPNIQSQVLWDLVAKHCNGAERESAFRALQQTLRLQQFNVSIGITDRFMEAVEKGAGFDLTWGGRVYRTVDARNLWETIMRSTWDWAEPGALFIDTINKRNNLYYCETIAATNPCGEQPLPPYGACLLGSFNLTRYVKPSTQDMVEGDFWMDWDQLEEDIPHVVRAMDNIVDRAIYPLPQQEREAKQKRRMGLGVTGVANAIEALGFPYGSADYVELQEQILSFINNECYRASAELAKEKGAFPLFDADLYCNAWMIKRLPEDIQASIRKHGIRNSHLTSIAPTGTISLAANNVSSGIEPVFAYQTRRTILRPEGPVEEIIEDYGVRVFEVQGKVTADCTIEDHLAVLANASQHVDSAVSKTCNVPPTIAWEDFTRVYQRAWAAGCKGITTFNSGGKRMGILVAQDSETGEMCRIDPVTGKRECGE